MKHKEIKPCPELAPFIHSFWELKGEDKDGQWERNFPDGCPGLVVNLGENCITDNGALAMEYGKTYVVGTMTSFKDSFISADTHLLGVCIKPGTFSNLYNYAPQVEITNNTVEFDHTHAFDFDKIIKDPFHYLNHFFIDNIRNKKQPLQPVIDDIHRSNGQLGIYEIARRNYTTVRQLERSFKIHIGVTPKEYTNIIRFQHALSVIKTSARARSLSDIAFDCGFYDHSHLTSEIKRNTGLVPSQL